MVDTTINKGDAYITDGDIVTVSNTNDTIRTSGNQIVVHIIPTTKIDYLYENAVAPIPIPITKQQRGQDPLDRIIDLKRIKEIVTVQGFLEDGGGSSAESKRDNLLTLGKKRGELTLVYGQRYSTNNLQTLWERNSDERGCFIMKMNFTSTTGKLGLNIGGGGGSQEPTERNISINVSLIRGKDM